MKLTFQLACLHRFFSGTHLIRITTNCIDLSVMHDETVRMGSLPAWCCIRTETGMYHGDS